MAMSSLLVPSVQIPQSDGSAWLSKLGGVLQDVGDRRRAMEASKELMGSGAATQPQKAGGFLSGFLPQQQTMAAPVKGADRSEPQGDVYKPFIETVKTKITNPYGLAAVAATGRAESGFSAGNANRTWSDPSQSGAPGTAGGVMSWRGPRLQAMQNFAAQKGERLGAISPQTQAEFFLQEDPNLIATLNSAGSPQEAADAMARAWAFAGHDNPDQGEAARRRALAQNYYAQEFGNQADGAAAAIEAQAPGGMGSPLTDQSFDDRFGPTALPAEVAQGRDGLTSALTEGNATAAMPAPAVDPVATAATQSQPVATAQPAQTSGNAATIPQNAQRISGELLGKLITNPYTRDIGVAIGKAAYEGRQQGFDFMALPNGDLIRTDKQGNWDRVGNFAKGANGLGADEAGLNLVYGQDADGNTVAFQPLKGGGLKQVELPSGIKLTPGISNIDTGTGTLTVNSKTGARVAETPKDLSGAEREKGTGKNAAESAAALPQVESSVQQMLASIDSLDKDPYLASMLGPVNSRLPSLTGDAARVQSKLDQITGQAFLQAYNSLRGGGQITEVEGKKATEAMGRLNTAQNEDDFRQALQEIRDVLNAARERALRSAGKTAPAANQTRSGVQWKIEE